MKNRHPLPENPLHKNTLYFLFASLVFAGLPHFWNLPLWVTGLFICSIGVKSLQVRNRKGFNSRIIPILLAVPTVIAIYFEYHTLLGMDASISLLIVMVGLKILELREYRDAMLVLFLGFFVVVTVFLFRQSLIMLPYLVTSGFMLTLCLHLINDFTGRQKLTDQIRVNTAMLISSIPMVFLLFVLFPRLDSPLWKLPGSDQQKTGMSDSMTPGQFSKLAQSSEPAFRVSFKGSLPAQDKLYWRGPVLSDFDGKRWTRADSTENSQVPEVDLQGNIFEYNMILEPHRSNWVFALDAPASFPQGTRLNKDLELVSVNSINKTASFQLTSALDFRLNNQYSSEQIQSALVLPGNTSPKTIKLAKSLFSDTQKNKKRFVNKILQYFNQQPFYYSLEPAPMASDYIDSFMFDTREGFCEHYASSFVVMMRAAGIPARVVTGYQGGEWNLSGEYLLVRQSDAHAWVEVWLEDSGWERFDPTAMVAPERVTKGLSTALSDTSLLPMSIRISFLKKLGMQWDGLNYQWTKWVVAYNNQLRNELLEKLKLSAGNWGRIIVGILLFIVTLILFWTTLFGLYRWWKKPSDKLLIHYQKFARKLEKSAGIKREIAETELAFARRVSDKHKHLAAPVHEITHLFNQIRYSGIHSRDQMKQLSNFIKVLKP